MLILFQQLLYTKKETPTGVSDFGIKPYFSRSEKIESSQTYYYNITLPPVNQYLI
jgi:hypothetical protein